MRGPPFLHVPAPLLGREFREAGALHIFQAMLFVPFGANHTT